MTVQELIAYAEKYLREDREYWEQMNKLKSEVENIIYRYNKIMAAVVIRLAISMVA